MTQSAKVDVAVIGAGPIGLETAAVLQHHGADVLCIEAGAIGNTIFTKFPPHTRFFTSPERLALWGMGLSAVHQEKFTGEEYLAYLRAYVLTHKLTVETFTTVTDVTGDKERGFDIHLRNRAGQDTTVRASRVVLATGGTDHPRKLGIPGEDAAHVSWFLGDPHRFFNRTVAVVGGRNSAVESAIRAFRAGAQVHLVHRGPTIHPRVKYWLKPEIEALIADGKIEAHFSTEIERIDPTAIWLSDGLRLQVDDVLLNIGYYQDARLMEICGIKRSGAQLAPVFDPATMETNRAGIFVAGTATAGTQDGFGVFIENSHAHARTIAAAITSAPPAATTSQRSELES